MARFLIIGLLSLAASAGAQSLLSTPARGGYVDFHDRLHDYIFRTYTDPGRLLWTLADSAKDTWWKDPHQWDRSPESYSYRVASHLGRRMVRNSLQLGLETALHEDSRYRISTEHSFRNRVWFAITSSVMAYRDDGSREPAYGRMLAGVGGAAISSTWHPQSIAADTLVCGVVEAALDRAANNLLREFQPDLLHFGKTTWKNFRHK